MSGSLDEGGGLADYAADESPPGGQGRKQTKAQRELLRTARKQWERTLRWEANFRGRFIDDLKIAEADSYNGYQWPNNIKHTRDLAERPSLTINKIRQHNLQIINDAKQHKPGIAIKPVGNEATYEAAQITEAIVRHIERQSKAQAHYDTATSFQVRAGYGVLRVATDYVNDDSWDLDIFIRPITDPLTVLFDPDCKMPDKSDAKFAFVSDRLSKDDFEELFPEYTGYSTQDPFASDSDDWVSQTHVRVAEYFYAVSSRRKLVRFMDPTTGELTVRKLDELERTMAEKVLDDPRTMARTVRWTEIRWALIIGNQIAEEKRWPGHYIPLVPVIGEETVIDGEMDRKGHTRALIDPQRMYNYWSSAAVEYGALQTKTPWVAPAAAIESFEDYWNTANQENTSVLPYNHIGDDGEPIPMPQRPAPPEQAPLYLKGMEVTQNEMMMVSGQYPASMGQPGNERSGTAIQERQRQGENATYHYIDNLSIAIRQVGEIILDLIPKVYNKKRIVQILAKDGTSMEVQIDPQAQKAYQEELNQDNQVISRVLNPTIGKYMVTADVGPAYATQRQEGFNALVQILSQAPQLAPVILDILMSNGDFPGAEEAAIRLKRMVPPQALGQGPTQAEQQLMAENQQLKMNLSKTFDELVTAKLKIHGKDQLRDIDAYKAETDRMKALGDALASDPHGVKAIIGQLVDESMQTSLMPVLLSTLPGLQSRAGQGGAAAGDLSGVFGASVNSGAAGPAELTGQPGGMQGG